VAALGFVTPEIPTEVCVLAGSEQEPATPLSASVAVTIGPAAVAPVALQPVKPVPSVIAGAPVTAKAEFKAVVIVEPATSAPFVALDLKPTVQVVTAPAACVPPAKEIAAAGAVAAAIDGDAVAAPSFDVVTLIVFAPVVVVFVIPRISKVAAMFFATAQVWPETLPSVTVTVVPTVAPETVHFCGNVAGVSGTIVGVAGRAPPVQVGKATLIVSVAPSAPELLGVKPIVQCVFAPAAREVAVAVTALTVAGSIT
jgi:hypothetical protein